jgi:hypothetical protein
MAGMELPNYLKGKTIEAEKPKSKGGKKAEDVEPIQE